MGFCEALMAPCRVAANQNTIARIINRTYFLFNRDRIIQLKRLYIGIIWAFVKL